MKYILIIVILISCNSSKPNPAKEHPAIGTIQPVINKPENLTAVFHFSENGKIVGKFYHINDSLIVRDSLAMIKQLISTLTYQMNIK